MPKKEKFVILVSLALGGIVLMFLHIFLTYIKYLIFQP